MTIIGDDIAYILCFSFQGFHILWYVHFDGIYIYTYICCALVINCIEFT